MTRRSPAFRVSPAFLGTVVAAVCAYACASTSNVVGETPDEDKQFTPNPDIDASGGELATKMCPSSECAAPFATCSTSQFLCDINLSNDSKNCGSCGFDCGGTDPTLGANFVCNEGKCAMRCLASDFVTLADCDGIPDNGCETPLRTALDCSACGDKCPAGQPCFQGKCGCPPPLEYCGGECIDTSGNEEHCGVCDNGCDLVDKPAPPHSFYGCRGSVCGKLKCEQFPPSVDWRDCNDDLDKPGSDGCEIDMTMPNNDHCGACGNKCPEGSPCDVYLNGRTQVFELLCACPDGLRDCGGKICIDVTSGDPFNCGACGRACPGAASALTHAQASCASGECKLECTEGWADCNDNPYDGCEVNLKSDPQHCGACGVVCDGVAGQACVAGKCATKPCGEVN